MADETKKKTGLLLDQIFTKHDTGAGHPESKARYDAITKQLEGDGWPKKTEPIALRDVTDEEVLLCHTGEYLKTAVKDIESGRSNLSTGDTAVCGDSLDVARKAAGGLLNAVDAVFADKVANAFCAVRPPGHHATPDTGMGFCIFNNAAIAARYAQKKHGVGKVAIIDWDVHHGNGTQDIFYDDESVFYFSTHQFPWYPGTGAKAETGTGKGLGSILNAPFSAGAGEKEVGGAFKDAFLPAMDKFKPELVIISAGFDSRKGDPLGHFTLEDEHFVELTKLLMELAKSHANGNLVSVLEGGYNVGGLAKAASAHLGALAG